MADHPPFDPRAVANCLLDFAWNYDLEVTHLALQKTVYFLHARFLKEFEKPLVTGHFEAWKHGPVHPQLWSSFKNSGRDTIRHHAYGLDIVTGAGKKLDEIDSPRIKLFIGGGSIEFLSMEAHRLVGLSHARNSPWDILTRTENGDRQYGSRISNDIIKERFHFHKISISNDMDSGDDYYEQPPT
jgi:uncharacterized phage-associated protein